MSKNKKGKSLDDMVGFQDLDNMAAPIDERSTLCIKNGIATNYRYNKNFPQHPYCVCNIICVYKNKIGDNIYCEYMTKKYEAERK